MNEHKITAPIIGGKIELLTVHDGNPDQWEEDDFHVGDWECSCGLVFEDPGDAAAHAEEVWDGTYKPD